MAKKKISQLPVLSTSNDNITAPVVDSGITKGVTFATLKANAGDALQALSQVNSLIASKADVSSGSGAPASTPGKVGDIYVDTTSKLFYYATGTAGASDWKSKVVSGAGAPGVTPDFIGQLYIDTTSDNAYIAIDTTGSGDFVQIDNQASAYQYEFEGDTAGSSVVTLGTVNMNGSGTNTTDLKITKPIMAYAFHNFATGTISGALQILQNGGYRTIASYSTSDVTTYNLTLNPGKYRLTLTGTGFGQADLTLYATGVSNGELTTLSILE